MWGFIKKDILMMKGNFKLLAILFIIYGVMAMEGEMDLSFLLPFMSVMIMISTFAYDQYNHWDSYLCSLPNGRKNSVKAKYLATLILIVVTTISITMLSFLIAYINAKTFSYEDIFSTVLGTLFATVLLQSFMYPSIYKFGLEKARIGIFVIVFGTAIIGGLLGKWIDFSSLFRGLSFLENYIPIILPILMIVILFISYKISEAIYLKKEF